MKAEKSSQPEAVMRKRVKKAEGKEQAASLAEKSGMKPNTSIQNDEKSSRKEGNKEKGASIHADEKKSLTASSKEFKDASSKATGKKTGKKLRFGFDELKRLVLMPSTDPTGEETDQDGQIANLDYEDLLANKKFEDIGLNKKTAVGDNYEIKNEPWKWKDWKDFACLGAMLALLLDPTQSAAFVSMALGNGGLYFVLFYLVLTVVVQLPILQLYVHIGQFHQQGVVRVFSLYGPIYRAIGICALVIYPISQSAKLETSVYNIVTGYSQGSNLTSIVSCVGNPFSYYGEYKYRDFCCHSLYDRMTCHDMKPKPEWCINKKKISHGKETAPGFHVKSLIGNLGTSEIIPPVVIGVVLLLAALGTFVPRPIFAAGVAVFGLIGLVMVVVLAVMQLSMGNFGIGFLRLNRLTYLYSFLTHKAPFLAIQVVVWTSLSKFPLISIASMISPGKKLYWPVIGIHVTQVLVTMLNFSGDLAMLGFMEQASIKFLEIPYWPSSIGALGYYHGILPEFFAITGTSGWYLFSSTIMFFVSVGPFCGSLFDTAANSFKRKKHRLYRHIAGSCVVVGMSFTAATVGEFHPPGVRAMHLITSLMYGVMAFLIAECTVRLYGENQHEVDLAAMYPPYNNWKDLFGPLSFFYVFCLRYIVPLAMVAFVFFGVNFFFKSIAPTLDGISMTICYGCGIFVLGSFVAGLVYDLIMIKRKGLPLWRTFLPTKGHKAYYRFFPNEDPLDSLLKSKESLESLSAGSDEEVTPWDLFSCENTQSEQEELEATQKESKPALNKTISGGKSSRRPSGKSLSLKKNNPIQKKSSLSQNKSSPAQSSVVR